MAKYVLSKEVPWKDILHILRWYILMAKNGCEARLQQKQTEPDCPDGILEPDCKSLQTGLHCYGSLRAFLGQSGKTVLEKEASVMLEEAESFCASESIIK